MHTQAHAHAHFYTKANQERAAITEPKHARPHAITHHAHLFTDKRTPYLLGFNEQAAAEAETVYHHGAKAFAPSHHHKHPSNGKYQNEKILQKNYYLNLENKNDIKY